LISGGWILTKFDWTEPAGHPLRARLVQGGIDQNSKFVPSQIFEGIRQHLILAAGEAKADPVNIVLLPETAIPVFQHQVPPALWNAWHRLAVDQGSTILTGVPLYDKASGRYTSGVSEIDEKTSLESLSSVSQGMLTKRYDKHHLVPFGEFIPWGFRWFVDLMSIPLGDFDRGNLQQTPFSVGDQLIAPNICYEDIFGREIIAGLSGQQTSAGASTQNATILANFSNLGWFGDSWALRQHWQMARMRAIETSRPMLRATNTGITGAIDHRGQAIASLPPMKPSFLDVSIQGQTGLTPYAQTGDSFILLICVGILLGAHLQRRKRQRQSP
jgi:apolipoprotein N-acyltransferase